MNFSSDCVCVSGIEHFIDPRYYLPQWDGQGDDFIPNIYEKELRKAEAEYAQKAFEANEQTNVGIDPERVAEFVVQRNVLVPTGFVHFVAYQIRSMYIRIKSLDSNWVNGKVSAVFTHNDDDQSVVVPVVALDTLVPIPDSVLKPGKLSIALMCIPTTGPYSVITTEPMEYRVYDIAIKPINWPKMRDFDIYQYYLSLAKNILADNKKLTETNLVMQENIVKLQEDVKKLQEEIKKLYPQR